MSDVKETLEFEDSELGFRRSELEDLSLEVRVLWGTSVLSVTTLSPPRDFLVGEGSTSTPVDVELPSDVLGQDTCALVRLSGDRVVALPDASSSSALEEGACGIHHVGGFSFQLSLGRKTKPLPQGLFASADRSPLAYLALSLTTFGGLFGSMAYFVPPLGLTDDSMPDMSRRLLLTQYLKAAAEREKKQEVSESPPTPESGGQTGKQAMGPEGAAGKETSKSTSGRQGVKGPKDTPKVEISRSAAIAEARSFGLAGMLTQLSSPSDFTNVFGGERTLGANDITAQGKLWDSEIGEAIGGGGLGVSGPGFGGGDVFGDGVGLGLERAGTGVLGGCTLGPEKCGFGPGRFGTSGARTGGGHPPKAPTLRMAPPDVSGRIPPEVIQRVVRQNFGRFRMCYERALGKNPSLEGRVAVRFVIGRDGAVSQASAGGGMADAAMVSCVQSAFYGLSFPPPEGGIVKVTYPLMFSPN